MEECLKQFPYGGLPHRTAIGQEEGPKCICTLQKGHKGLCRCRCGYEWDDIGWWVRVPKSQDDKLNRMLFDLKLDREVRELATVLRMIWGRLPHAVQEQVKKVEDMLG